LAAEHKPLISVVWLGTFLLMFGFSVSILYRWADQKKREALEKEGRDPEMNDEELRADGVMDGDAVAADDDVDETVDGGHADSNGDPREKEQRPHPTELK
jgi:hypothetical protein